MNADVTTAQAFTFSWREQPEGFLKWFLPTVMSSISKEQMDDLSNRTSHFGDVRVQILINGVEVNAENFLHSVERHMDIGTRDEARRMLDEVGGLDALEERIGEIRSRLITQVESALRERGIELPDRDEW